MNTQKAKQREAISTLESLLVSQRLLSPEQVVQTHSCMAQTDVNFGTALMYLQLLPVSVIAKVLQEKAGIPSDISAELIASPGMKRVITAEKAKALQVFPISFIEESGQRVLLLGMTDPLDTFSQAKVHEMCRLKVQPMFVTLEQLQALYRTTYHTGLEIFPPEITAFNEKTARSRAATVVSSTETRKRVSQHLPSDHAYLQALIALLDRRGIISVDELNRKAAELCS
ncbi:MAG: hypothetical protein HY537_07780 [Deltaproteobacteria bacterium]|nr:hypothetical protein [Deltaproteobacteria bacterium]